MCKVRTDAIENTTLNSVQKFLKLVPVSKQNRVLQQADRCIVPDLREKVQTQPFLFNIFLY